MTQTTNRFFDEIARLMNDAAGVAEGVRREIQTLVQAQAERILRDMDVVTREEFEAAKEMAAKAREENERLAARLAEVEKQLGNDPQKGKSPRQSPDELPQACGRCGIIIEAQPESDSVVQVGVRNSGLNPFQVSDDSVTLVPYRV